MPVFNLENSDATISSYYTISDLVRIINKRLRPDNPITEHLVRQNFHELITHISDNEVIEEINGFKKIWYSNIIQVKKLRPNNVQNHYELVLYSIFCRVVDEKNIYVQYQINGEGHKFDFMIEYNGQKYLIEFEGINHYKPYRGNVPVHPLDKQRNFNIEGYKLILWPYWIQRCELNLKVILGIEKKGLGAIWSSNYHFGEFPWKDTNQVIRELNNQFNIERDNEIGYIYGPNTVNRNNPENPVVKNILNPTMPNWTRKRLIPKGTLNDRNYWLPQILKE